jgi:hypothetical protein
MIEAAEAVVMNRVRSGFEGDKTVHDVVSQMTGKYPEFDGYNSALWKAAGNPDNLSGDAMTSYGMALQSALLLYTGSVKNPAGGATYFYNLSDKGNPPVGFFTKALKDRRLTYYGAVPPSMLLLGPPH